MLTKILSWLLHHANRLGKDEYFYKIKNNILSKYGAFICFDVQFIEGKKCYSCRGTGEHVYYRWDGTYDYDFCWHCHNGWYKRRTWNILSRIKFGKYEFHQPFQRVYHKPYNGIPVIEGYFDHEKSKYSNFAKTILFLIYEKGYLKRWYKTSGIVWRLYWWLPKNWINNIIHLIKHGRKSWPIIMIKEKINKLFERNKQKLLVCWNDYNYSDNNLPF